MIRTTTATTACILALVPGVAPADEIVQEGNLQGGLGTEMHEIILDQLDPAGGLQLNFVRLEFLTAVVGGGMADGSGIPVSVYAQIDADYFLGPDPLAQTSAVIDTVIPNSSPSSFTLFDNDSAEVVIDEPEAMAAWIGSGSIQMDATTFFEVSEDPTGIVGFGAGGSISYTVTYDYDVDDVTGDANGDGVVNVDDLVLVILNWGPCPGAPEACPGDVDGSERVDVDDLVLVVLNWTG